MLVFAIYQCKVNIFLGLSVNQNKILEDITLHFRSCDGQFFSIF